MSLNRSHRLQGALSRLKALGLRITPARTAILKTLIEKHGPFSKEELQAQVGCDLVTIYRSIEVLEKNQLVQRCEFGDGTSRYEFNDPESHHHHVVCRTCGKQEEVAICPSENLNKAVAKMGYKNVGHLISFFGVCQSCDNRARPR